MRSLFKRFAMAASFILSVGFISGAQAVLVNFDDLTRVPGDPEFPCFCDHPLTNEYESQGLIIDGGFLTEYSEGDENAVSGKNFMLGSNYLKLEFVGALPTFVSMIVSAQNQEAIFFDVFGMNGLIDQQQTNGYAGPFNDTPYTPNQLMTFTSGQGISSIVIEGFYNLRVSAMIDDLNYEYTSTSVPAPSPLVMLVMGMLLFGWRKFGSRRISA